MLKKYKFIILLILLPLSTAVYSLFAKQSANLFPCLASVICIIIFAFFHSKFSFLNTFTYYAVITFILLSLFAGKTLNFYYIIPYWDKILHFISGFLFSAIASQFYSKINGNTNKKSSRIIFILSFAIAIAGLWEIFEFISDMIFKTASQNGSLNDTMLDIIAGSVSAMLYVLFFKHTNNQ